MLARYIANALGLMLSLGARTIFSWLTETRLARLSVATDYLPSIFSLRFKLI